MAMLDQVWRSRPDTLAAQVDPTFRRYRHSRLLARQFRDLIYSDDRHQIITTQPQIGKTTICSQWGPVWLLDEDPTSQIMLTSYAVRLARRNARAARNILRDNRANLRTSLAPDQTAADYWVTPQGGYVLASGVDGSITGFSGGVVIIDDPHKNRREANSIVKRNTVWEWWTDDVTGRLQGDEKVMIVMTRWHVDDLVGRLLEREPGKWKVTALPAIAEPDIAGPDPLGRQTGEVVCEERFTLEQMEARREAVGARTWASLYQCRPTVAEGEILKRDWWVWEDIAPAPHLFDMLITSWDLTFDQDGESWSVGQLWGKMHTSSTAHYWLLDQVRGKWSYTDQRRMVLSFADKHRQATHHLIEKAANGAAMIDELRPVLRGLVGINPGAGGSKKTRAEAVTPLLEASLVHIPGWHTTGSMDGDGKFRDSWVDRFVDECAAFQGLKRGEVNDQVDTATQALRWLSDSERSAALGTTGLGRTRDR